jgi:tripartite-type tricarboxylate transporter receptor subunit TctC
LIAFSRAEGRTLSVGDSGLGSTHYFAAQLFAHGTGIEVTHVPYRGTSAVIADLLAGHIDMASIELSIARSYLDGNQLAPIGLSALRRDPEWPNLPTLAEQGLADYEVTSWFGYFAPAGTPVEIVESLNKEINIVLGEAEVRGSLSTAGLRVLGGSIADFHEHLKREHAKWDRAVRLAPSNLKKPNRE